MTKIVAISDMHGQLPQHQTIPDSDILLIAGDICCHGRAKEQLNWLDGRFRWWLEKLNRPVFACAGNHDWVFYEKSEDARKLGLPWTYLQDESANFDGLKIYGTPWQKEFFNWAYNLTEHELTGKWNLIPSDTDILICHSPPKFYGDLTLDGNFIGSESLTWRIEQMPHLKLVAFGHNHQGYGEYKIANGISGAILANVSVLNDDYRLVNKPYFVEIVKNYEKEI